MQNNPVCDSYKLYNPLFKQKVIKFQQLVNITPHFHTLTFRDMTYSNLPANAS